MTDTPSRRDTLKCLGVGAGTLFTLSGGILSTFDMARSRNQHWGRRCSCKSATPISDSTRTPIPTWSARSIAISIDAVNAHAQYSRLSRFHTGDVTHLSKASGIRYRQQSAVVAPAGQRHCIWCRVSMT